MSRERALVRVSRAAQDVGKPWGSPVLSDRDRDFTRKLGISFQAVTDDQTALREGLKAALDWARGRSAPQADEKEKTP